MAAAMVWGKLDMRKCCALQLSYTCNTLILLQNRNYTPGFDSNKFQDTRQASSPLGNAKIGGFFFLRGFSYEV